ncbi:MAG: peptidoglycan DD-metalloendopeptidase family protein, partial [Candidatus Woesearchaeota archaeon]
DQLPSYLPAFDYRIVSVNESDRALVYAITKKRRTLTTGEKTTDLEGKEEGVLYEASANLLEPLAVDFSLVDAAKSLTTQIKSCTDFSCVEQKERDFRKAYPENKLLETCYRPHEKAAYAFYDQYRRCQESPQFNCTCILSLQAYDASSMPKSTEIVLFPFSLNTSGIVYENYAPSTSLYLQAQSPLAQHPKLFDKLTVTIEGKKATLLAYEEDQQASLQSFSQPSAPGSSAQGNAQQGQQPSGLPSPAQQQFLVRHRVSYENEIIVYKRSDDSLAFLSNAQQAAGIASCYLPEPLEKRYCMMTSDKHLFFDSSQKAYRVEQLGLRFAISLNDTTLPDPLPTLPSIADKANADDTVLVQFAPLAHPKVIYYGIYVADKPFTSVADATLVERILVRNPMTAGVITYELALPDGVQQYVAVAPQTMRGALQPSVTSVPALSIDDNPPLAVRGLQRQGPFTSRASNVIEVSIANGESIALSWQKPLLSKNGQLLTDLQGYFIFVNPSDPLPKYTSIQSCLSAQEKCIYTKETSYTLTGLAPGTYTILVVGFDEAFNYEGAADPAAGAQQLFHTSFAIPFSTPTMTVNSCFALRSIPGEGARFHTGIDVAGPTGTPITAVADGVVTFTCVTTINSYYPPKRSDGCGGYGASVYLQHVADDPAAPALETRYGHLSSVLVRKGQFVRQGQVIGLMGNTGHSTGPHLHFEVRKDGKPYNPLCFFPEGSFTVRQAGSCKNHVPQCEPWMQQWS